MLLMPTSVLFIINERDIIVVKMSCMREQRVPGLRFPPLKNTKAWGWGYYAICRLCNSGYVICRSGSYSAKECSDLQKAWPLLRYLHIAQLLAWSIDLAASCNASAECVDTAQSAECANSQIVTQSECTNSHYCCRIWESPNCATWYAGVNS